MIVLLQVFITDTKITPLRQSPFQSAFRHSTKSLERLLRAISGQPPKLFSSPALRIQNIFLYPVNAAGPCPCFNAKKPRLRVASTAVYGSDASANDLTLAKEPSAQSTGKDRDAGGLVFAGRD